MKKANSRLEMQNENQGRGNGIISGTLSLTISTIIVKLLGVIYKIPLAHLLGEEGMGYFNSAYTVYAFFYLLCTAGVPKAVMILVSEAKAKGSSIEEKNIVRTAAKAFLILGSLVTAVFIIFSSQLANMIGNSRSALTMVAIAPSIVFISLAGVIRGYLSANMKLFSIAVSQIVEGVGKLVLGLVFAVKAIEMGLPISVVSALTILGVTFGSIFGTVYLLICAKIKKARENLEQNKLIAQKQGIMKRIFRISIPITISAAVMSITNIIDLGMIMRRLERIGYTQTEATALYGNYTTLAVSMFNLVVSILTPVSVTFLPVFTHAHTNGDKRTFSSSLKSALELSAFISAPLMIGMMVYSGEVLSLIFGDTGIETGAPLLCILAPGLLFMSVLLIVNSGLEASGQVKAPVISMLVGSIIKIVISYFLLANPDFGISGAPIGTVVSYAVALIISTSIASKKCDIQVPLFTSYLLPHLNALASVLASMGIYRYVQKALGGTVATLSAIAVSAFLYLVLSLFTGVIGRKKLKEMSKYTNFA